MQSASVASQVAAPASSPGAHLVASPATSPVAAPFVPSRASRAATPSVSPVPSHVAPSASSPGADSFASPIAAPVEGGTHHPSLAHLERRAGRLLRALRDGDLLRRVGYVRLGDYVIERLGVSYRTAQEWMRVDESLEQAPLVAAAFESGELTSAQVRLLTRVVGVGDEERWVAQARRLDVRGLGRAVAAWERDNSDGVSRNRSGDVPESDGEDLETVPVELPVPAWLYSSWCETVTFARQLAGAVVSRGECLEMVTAELLGSLKPGPQAAQEDGGEPAVSPQVQSCPGGKPESNPDLPPSARTGSPVTSEGPVSAPVGNPVETDLPAPSLNGSPVTPDLPVSAHDLPGTNVDLPPSAPSADSTSTDLPASAFACGGEACASEQVRRAQPSVVTETIGLGVRAIHRELRGLMAQRQKREWALAEGLRGVAMMRTFRLDGFASLEEYARERFGLSPRGTYRLLALHRTLERLPALRRSFLAGKVTLRQALVVGSVATVVTELAWIARARSVTLRRLEDEVCFWKHLEEVRPAVWELLAGAPLPEGIVLVPGRPARLSTSARWGDLTGTELPVSTPQSDRDALRQWRSAEQRDDDLPTSAPVRRQRLTVERLLAALADSEGAIPLPDHMVRIRLRVEPGVKALWDSAVAHCRSTIGSTIAEWEVLALGLAAFWKTWDNMDTRRQRRENPTLDRDGWRCMAPGCWSMGTGRLHEHHIIFKSHGGALEDPRNLVAACTQHHKRMLHEGFIRCTGDAPDELIWAYGVDEGQEPFLLYEGETLVAGEAA